MGSAAMASNGGAAYGDNSVATGPLSSAIGPGARATFGNSTAIGNGAATTRADQVAIGTGKNTYTLAGINSLASLGAQSGTLRVVTADPAGNLATAPFPGGGTGTVDLSGI